VAQRGQVHLLHRGGDAPEAEVDAVARRARPQHVAGLDQVGPGRAGVCGHVDPGEVQPGGAPELRQQPEPLRAGADPDVDELEFRGVAAGAQERTVGGFVAEADQRSRGGEKVEGRQHGAGRSAVLVQVAHHVRGAVEPCGQRPREQRRDPLRRRAVQRRTRRRLVGRVPEPLLRPHIVFRDLRADGRALLGCRGGSCDHRDLVQGWCTGRIVANKVAAAMTGISQDSHLTRTTLSPGPTAGLDRPRG
jgi:hypothetical protein